VDGKAGTDRRRHRFLDDVDGLTGPSPLGRLFDGSLLHAGDPARHADHHARLGKATLVHLLDEVPEHLLADLEVRDHAILQRTDRLDVARCAANHFLGLHADRQRRPVDGVDRYHGRLVEDDALATHVHQRVGSAKVDRKISAHRERVSYGHGGTSASLVPVGASPWTNPRPDP